MKLEEMYLNENDSEMLADLLKMYNKDRPYKDQKTFQQYAEELMHDAIYFEWKMMKSI